MILNILAVGGALYFLYLLVAWYQSKKKSDAAIVKLRQMMITVENWTKAGELIDQRVEMFKQYEFSETFFPDLSNYKPQMVDLILERDMTVDDAYDSAKALKEGVSVPDKESDEFLNFRMNSFENLVGSDRLAQHRQQMIKEILDNHNYELRDAFLMSDLRHKKEVADAAVADSWNALTGGRTQEERTEDMRSNFPSLLKEAEGGSSLAMWLVSTHYDSETFPEERNLQEAFRWMERAASSNFSGAQHQVAYMYRDGVGVLQNYVLAHMWFNIAVLNADVKDADLTTGETQRDFYLKERNELALKMTPAQIAEAQAMAEKKNTILSAISSKTLATNNESERRTLRTEKSETEIHAFIREQLYNNDVPEDADPAFQRIQKPVLIASLLNFLTTNFTDLVFGEVIVLAILDDLIESDIASESKIILRNVRRLYEFYYVIASTAAFSESQQRNMMSPSAVTQMLVRRSLELTGDEEALNFMMENNSSFDQSRLDNLDKAIFDLLKQKSKETKDYLEGIALRSTLDQLDHIETLPFRTNTSIFEDVLNAEANNKELFNSKRRITSRDLFNARKKEQAELEIVSSRAEQIKLDLQPYFSSAENSGDHHSATEIFDALDTYIKSIDECRLKLQAIGGFLANHFLERIEHERDEIAISREGLMRQYLINGKDLNRDKLMEDGIQRFDVRYAEDLKSQVYLAIVFGYIETDKIGPYAFLNHEHCAKDMNSLLPDFAERLIRLKADGLVAS